MSVHLLPDDIESVFAPSYCGGEHSVGTAYKLNDKPPPEKWCRECIEAWCSKHNKPRWPYRCHCVTISQDGDRDMSKCWLHTTNAGRGWVRGQDARDLEWYVRHIEAGFDELVRRLDEWRRYLRDDRGPGNRIHARLKESRMWFRDKVEDERKVLR